MADERGASADKIERESSLDDSERAELQNPGYEIFIAALSILSIVNLVLMEVLRRRAARLRPAGDERVCSAASCSSTSACGSRPPSRAATTSSAGSAGPTCSRALPLAQLKVLRVFRLIRVYRLLKEYGVRNIGRSLRAERAGSALLSLLLIAILVLEFGSLWMLRIESSRTRRQHHHRLGLALVRHRDDLHRGLRRPVPGDQPGTGARRVHHRPGRGHLRHAHRLPRQPVPRPLVETRRTGPLRRRPDGDGAPDRGRRRTARPARAGRGRCATPACSPPRSSSGRRPRSSAAEAS